MVLTCVMLLARVELFRVKMFTGCLVLIRVMLPTCVMVLTCFIVLKCVMVSTDVMVLARIIVLACVMVSAFSPCYRVIPC